MLPLPDNKTTAPLGRLTPRDIQLIAKARSLLERFDLADYPLGEALAHLRAAYALKRRGLRDYVLDLMGPLANQPLGRFRLYADTQGEQPLPLPDDVGQRLVDYLVETFDQRSLPGLIELTRGREGEDRNFYL